MNQHEQLAPMGGFGLLEEAGPPTHTNRRISIL